MSVYDNTKRTYSGQSLYSENIDIATGGIQVTSGDMEGLGKFSLTSSDGYAMFDSSEKRTGDKTLLMSITANGGDIYLYPDVYVPVLPQTEYEVSFAYKTNGTNDLSYIDVSIEGNSGTVTARSFLYLSNDWTIKTFNFTTKSDAFRLSFYFSFYLETESSSSVWIDINSFSLKQKTRQLNIFYRDISLLSGGVPRSTSGWIENVPGVWFVINKASIFSVERDNSMDGPSNEKTIRASVDSLGRVYLSSLPSEDLAGVSTNAKYLIPVKPNTQYSVKVPIKSNNLSTGNTIAWQEYNSSYIRTKYTAPATIQAGTSSGFTNYVFSITTGATAIGASLLVRINVAGNTSDLWLDQSGIEINEVKGTEALPTRTSSQQKVLLRESDKCLLFSGASNVSVPNASIPPSSFSGGFSFFFPLFFSNIPSSLVVIANKGTTSSGASGLSVLFDGASGARRIGIGINGTVVYSTQITGQLAGIWLALTIVVNASGVATVYLNGTEIIPPTYIADLSTITTTQPLLFGSGPAGANQFNGKIDSIFLWTRAIEQTEADNVFYKNIIPATGLLSSWLLNEGSGSIANDSTSSKNGTISGATFDNFSWLKNRTLI